MRPGEAPIPHCPEGARSPASGRGGGGGGRLLFPDVCILFLVAITLIAPFIGFLRDVRVAGQYHDRTWEQVRASGTLRVGMDAGVPPFAMPGNGDLQGFDPDLARDLAARLGLTATIVNTPSDALYDALLTGKVDALIAALPVTPEFRRDVAYSAPYIEMGERAIVRVGSDIETPAGLAHRRVGVELGSDGDLAARTLARRVPIDLHSTYDSGDAALADLTSGGVDAVVLDGIAARHAVATDPAFIMLADPVLSNGYVIATKQDARILSTNLDRALAEARAAGILTQLEARWLSGPA
jgi:ABC-type amino acid transport substrate-binding protein